MLTLAQERRANDLQKADVRWKKLISLTTGLRNKEDEYRMTSRVAIEICINLPLTSGPVLSAYILVSAPINEGSSPGCICVAINKFTTL